MIRGITKEAEKILKNSDLLHQQTIRAVRELEKAGLKELAKLILLNFLYRK